MILEFGQLPSESNSPFCCLLQFAQVIGLNHYVVVLDFSEMSFTDRHQSMFKIIQSVGLELDRFVECHDALTYLRVGGTGLVSIEFISGGSRGLRVGNGGKFSSFAIRTSVLS
ncbi:hypothetical protein TNCV_189021 [Trichonephila clavipes]|nr:hypothetical protein TNCV_189021 [Trichonephila clavipes]